MKRDAKVPAVVKEILMPAKTSCAMVTKTSTKKKAKSVPTSAWRILEKRYGSKKLFELKPSTVQKVGLKLKKKYRLAPSQDTCTNTKNISQLVNLSRRITNNSATAMIASKNVQRLVEEIKKSGMAKEYILKNGRGTLERYNPGTKKKLLKKKLKVAKKPKALASKKPEAKKPAAAKRVSVKSAAKKQVQVKTAAKKLVTASGNANLLAAITKATISAVRKGVKLAAEEAKKSATAAATKRVPVKSAAKKPVTASEMSSDADLTAISTSTSTSTNTNTNTKN